MLFGKLLSQFWNVQSFSVITVCLSQVVFSHFILSSEAALQFLIDLSVCPSETVKRKQLFITAMRNIIAREPICFSWENNSLVTDSNESSVWPSTQCCPQYIYYVSKKNTKNIGLQFFTSEINVDHNGRYFYCRDVKLGLFWDGLYFSFVIFVSELFH